jgi:WD40 repeat protein
MDGTIHLWDYANEAEIGSFETSSPIWTLDWSPDAQQIAFGGLVNTSADFIGFVEVSEIIPKP